MLYLLVVLFGILLILGTSNFLKAGAVQNYFTLETSTAWYDRKIKKCPEYVETKVNFDAFKNCANTL